MRAIDRDEAERNILSIIYAENSTPARGIAFAKGLGVKWDDFTTVDRRLTWLIAENATDRDHALMLLRMAIRSGDVDPIAEEWAASWYWCPHHLRRFIEILRGFKMKGAI